MDTEGIKCTLTLCVLLLLYMVIRVSEGQIEEAFGISCPADGTYEVIENSTNNSLTCTSFDPKVYRMMWTWYTNGTYRDIGFCRRNNSCDNLSPLFSVSWHSSNATRVTVDTRNTSLFSESDLFINSAITCTQDVNYPWMRHSCRTDYIYPALNTSCSARFQTSAIAPWAVVTKCVTPKARSALRRYYCQLLNRRQVVGDRVTMETTPLADDYVKGSCSLTFVLPADAEDVAVMVVPGRINVNVIRRPNTYLNHTCPLSVEEGSDLRCTCSAEDSGSPPGFLQWLPASGTFGWTKPLFSAILRHYYVTRSDHHDTFVCQLLWNSTTVAFKSYTLTVLWPPGRPEHNCPQSVAAGSSVNCECFSRNVGNPPATFTWQTSGSARLLLHNVTADDHGRHFECQATWRGSRRNSVGYTVQIHGAVISQVRSEEHASDLGTGIGAGFAAGLFIALIGIAGLLIYSWRRGWTLPCADRQDGSAAHNAEPTLRTPADALYVNDYDGLEHGDVNQRSTYENLQPMKSRGLAKFKRKKKREKAYENQPSALNRPHGETSRGNKRPKKTRKTKQEEKSERTYENQAFAQDTPQRETARGNERPKKTRRTKQEGSEIYCNVTTK